MKILIIEDSPRLLRSLGYGFRRLGHAVDLAADGREGCDYARFNDYDVIVLDLMLPGMDGLGVLRELRDRGRQTHVLILSARDRVEDRVRGLELGADDYLIKPFAFDELRARLDSLVRRRYERKNPRIVLGALTVDTGRREARRERARVDLTRSEYAILEYLALNRGRVRSKDQILERIRDGDSFADSNVVEVVICTLRKKIGNGESASLIKTRRGYGYYIE
ncbi:MAG: response regulator transcription factor [Opitutaceae bacterium]